MKILAACLIFIVSCASSWGQGFNPNNSAPNISFCGGDNTVALGGCVVPLGVGLNFASLGQAIALASPTLGPGGPFAFTVSVVINTTAFNSTSQTRIMGQSVNSSVSGWFAGDNGQYSSNVYFDIFPIGSGVCGSNMACISRSLVNNGANHLLTFVYTGYQTGLIQAYLDGTQEYSVGQDFQYEGCTTCNFNFGAANTNLTLTDVRIYSGAQSGTTIAAISALVQSGFVPSPSNPLSTDLLDEWPLSASTISCSSGNCTLTEIINGNTARINSVPPTAAITSPTNGATGLSGAVELVASCTDAIACTSVQFTIDGSSACSASSSPWQCSWNSATYVDRAHTIGCTATDESGLTSTCATITVTTSNGVTNSNYYVAATGSDTGNNCKTEASPCLTLAKAQSLGFYGGDNLFLSGTLAGCLTISPTNLTDSSAAYPLTITNGAGGYTIAANCTSGWETGYVAAMTVANVSGVTVMNGMILGNGSQNLGVGIFNTSGAPQSAVTVENMTVNTIYYTGSTYYTAGFYIQSDFAAAGSWTNVSIINNTCAGVSGTTSPDDSCVITQNFGQNLFNLMVQGNIAYDLGGHANSFASGSGIIFNTNGSNTASFVYNLAHDNGKNVNTCGGGDPFEIAASIGVHVWRNEAYNQTRAGGCDGGGGDFDISTQNSVMEQNYFHNNADYCMLAYAVTTSIPYGGNIYRNNICEDNLTNTSDGAEGDFSANGSGAFQVYNNTSYAGTSGVTNSLFFQFGSTPGADLIANNIWALTRNTATTFTDFVNGQENNISAVSFYANGYDALNGGTYRWYQVNSSGTTYTSLAAWQAVATGGDAGAVVGTPGWPSPGMGGTLTWTPSTQVGVLPGPAAYQGLTLAGMECTGYNNSYSGPDYYGTLVPGTSGTGYNFGAYGGGCGSAVLPAANNVQANWQRAGLVAVGGIPARTVQCGSTVTPSGLTPPTSGDDFALVTAAIAACPVGEFVLLNGNFVFAQSELPLVLDQGITLRGAGPCTKSFSNVAPACPTWITVHDGALPTYAAGGQCGVTSSTGCTAAGPVIYMSPSGNFDWGWGSCGHTNPCNSGVPLAADAAQGATTIQVTQTSSFSVGDWVLIDESSGAEWQSDPVSALGQTWAASDFQTTNPQGGAAATGRIVWGYHNPAFAIDNFASPQYPYNTVGGISCGYGINCDRATAEMHLITAIGAGPCPGTSCTLTFDSPLTIAFRQSGGWQGTGYISAGSGSSSPGSTLTVVSTTSGALAADQPLWWSGITGSAAISYVTSGSGTSWTTSNAQTNGTSNTSILVGSPGSPVAITAAAHNAQVLLPAHQNGASLSVLQQAGVENLSISRGPQGNIAMQFCVYCWVKNVDSFGWFAGAVIITASARSEVTGSYLHDGYDLENNGAEYALALDAATTENLVDNNIFLYNGKSMVGRACGGGNVVSYNYADDTLYMATVIGNYFVDHSINGSHYLGCHHGLFEGNWGNTAGDDDTHGAIMMHTYFRNQIPGLRTPFSDPSFTTTTSSTYNPSDATEDDQTQVCFATGQAYPYTGGCGPIRAMSEMMWNYGHSFSANVLGKSGVTTAGNGYVFNGQYGTNNLMIQMLGWNNVAPSETDPNLTGVSPWIWIDGNYDYYHSSVEWSGGTHGLPVSLYLMSAPSFFRAGVSATYAWPWVTPTSTPQVQVNSLGGSGLPAQARWNAGTPFVQQHHDDLLEPANDNDQMMDVARALNAA